MKLRQSYGRIFSRTVGDPLRWIAGQWHMCRTLDALEVDTPAPCTVLVVGIYLADRAHRATHLAGRFSESRRHAVTQAWAALGGEPDSKRLAAVTVERIANRVPKFLVLNRLLESYELPAYDFVIVTDDDITLPHGFLDAFLGYQQLHDLALAQPARTRWSFTDHRFVLRRPGIAVRRTRFVEIGPMFCIRQDLIPSLLPFDAASPMGWGYDSVWPCIAEDAGLRIGIVDATPVDHSLRRQGVTYSRPTESDNMRAYLSGRRHLDLGEACVVLESFPDQRQG